MSTATQFDPFSTRDLVDLPGLDQHVEETWSGFVFEAKPQNELLALASIEQSTLQKLETEVLQLDIADLPLPDLDSTTSSLLTSKDANFPAGKGTIVAEDVSEDVWKELDFSASTAGNKLVSWDHFKNAEHVEPRQTFVSEAPPTTFDLLLRNFLPKTHDENIKYAKPEILVKALIDVSVGRNSVLFQWNGQAQRFEALDDNFTRSGVTQETLQTILTLHLDAGAQFKRLKQFGQSHYHQKPARISLQTAVSTVVNVIEDVIEQSRYRIRSLIQLQDVFSLPLLLLTLLDKLARTVRSITKDSDLINAVLTFTENVSLEGSHFEYIVHAIVLRMANPVLRVIEAEAGLASWDKVCQMQDKELSALLQSPAIKTLEQIRSTFRILQGHGFDLLALRMQQSSHNKLTIEYNLEEIAQLQRGAELYEMDFRELIISLDGPSASHNDTMNPNLEMSRYPADGQQPFTLDVGMFSNPQLDRLNASYSRANTDELLQRVVSSALTAEALIPVDMISSCRQAIDLSVTPVFRAQHRLLSYLVLQVLFMDHKFVSHVELLGRFQLLSDGAFVSKLSMSLFEAEQVSGEMNHRTHTKTGLRLQNRETWPPASSELRLALVDVLSESMSNIQDTILTDSVSFAIRDLSDEDLEKCRDIDSIYALDFLKLNYKSPSTVLEAVITSNALETYDKIFNQLLRLLRIKSLTQSMLHNVRRRDQTSITNDKEHKFRLEAQRFTSALAEYCQDVVVKSSWLPFETQLKQIATRLSQKDYTGTLELAGGLDHLREMHEEVLDKMMRGLLLKQRQSEANGIIDRLFAVILHFAAMASKANSLASNHASDKDDGNVNEAMNNTTIPKLRKDFEMHVKALVRWLEMESGRAGNDGGELFEQLLLKLDWNGYWSR